MNLDATSSAATDPTITVISSDGVQKGATEIDLRKLITGSKFLWVDMVGGNEVGRARFLGELGFDAADVAWGQRFEQAGSMVINRRRLLAVTWVAECSGKSLIEIHILGSKKCVLTIWNGDPSALDAIHKHFAERAAELEKSPLAAAAILLQLLLSTLDSAISELDGRLEALRTQVQHEPQSIEFLSLAERLQRLQAAWSDVDRYSSAVRTAIIGIEALPGIDPHAAVELKEYAEQVEHLNHRFQERTRWGADIVNDYATAIAQRQADQISRLTVVALIFLPITFLTGFFGMNFNWLVEWEGSETAFIVLGIALPILSVVATVLWLKRRRLM
jgi:Mg2+ and Co2+ transporter CorA